MNNEAKVAELTALHKLLEEQIAEKEEHHADDIDLKRLKKQKLQIKDQIESLKG